MSQWLSQTRKMNRHYQSGKTSEAPYWIYGFLPDHINFNNEYVWSQKGQDFKPYTPQTVLRYERPAGAPISAPKINTIVIDLKGKIKANPAEVPPHPFLKDVFDYQIIGNFYPRNNKMFYHLGQELIENSKESELIKFIEMKIPASDFRNVCNFTLMGNIADQNMLPFSINVLTDSLNDSEIYIKYYYDPAFAWIDRPTPNYIFWKKAIIKISEVTQISSSVILSDPVNFYRESVPMWNHSPK